MTEDSFRIFAEGGRSCEWFTELKIVDGTHVKILSHYRLFWDEYDSWPDKNKKDKNGNLISHPGYYGTDIMKKEGEIKYYNLPQGKENVTLSNCVWCEVIQ
jgi:hypothetical protein